jgi:hypothetical protein
MYTLQGAECFFFLKAESIHYEHFVMTWSVAMHTAVGVGGT